MTKTEIAADTQGTKVAEFISTGELQTQAIERAPGIFESRGIGNSYLITTSDGDVLVNAGALGDARRGQVLFGKISKNPIRHIVLTQSHANQFGGLEVYKTPTNTVIAHRLYPLEREYNKALSQHYQRGSRRIFGSITGKQENILPTIEISPDLLIDDQHTFELGGRRFELIWTPGGETRSSLVVWLPDEKIVLVGNLFGPLLGNQPNLNTLRGDKPRSALEFVESVKRVRELGAELLLTGHESISGAKNIEQLITRIADSVQWIHDRTIQGMNDGVDLRTLMREVKPPQELTLTEEYGKVAWNVRAIWHEYTGWFDPSQGITELYDVPASSIAPAIVELAGGTNAILDKANEFISAHKLLEALHLVEIALTVEPLSPLGRETKKNALTLLAQKVGTKNLWERMSIAAGIRELDSTHKPS
ncbi:MAG: alkyl sulfatase dimerization domain-containing protein [Spongiibacteraceae bacterium]